MAQFTSASLVLAPRCGSKITSENSLDLFTNSGVGKSVTKQPILLQIYNQSLIVDILNFQLFQLL